MLNNNYLFKNTYKMHDGNSKKNRTALPASLQFTETSENGNRFQNFGFTLVEMIVTIVIISILATLTISGIITWQKWSDYRRQNEYAQTLFVAAQNQLTEYGANGQIVNLQKDILGTTVNGEPDLSSDSVKSGLKLSEAVLSKMTDEQGNAYDLETIWPESKGKEAPEKYQKTIVSLRAEAGQYSNYLADPTGYRKTNPQAYWVYELLSSYVYDTTIINDGAICVELTPQDGQIFSVSYSDKNTKFIYTAAGESGEADISNREEEIRQESMIGFYASGSLYASTKNKPDKVSVSKVKLFNKDTFYLTFTLNKSRELTSTLNYQIDLLDDETRSKRLSISLDGRQLKNESHASAIDCEVIRYQAETDENGHAVYNGKNQPVFETQGTVIGTFPVMAWVDTSAVVHVILDAADIQATSYLYNDACDFINAKGEYASKTIFSKTNSFFRFGVEPDRKLQASVSAAGDGGFQADAGISSKAKTPCFAKGVHKSENGEDSFEYVIENERHLYNIRYIEGISYEKQASSSALTTKVSKVTFSLNSSLDWSLFEANGNLYDSVSKTSYVDLSMLGCDRYDCPFPSVKEFRENDILNGNDQRISHFTVTEAANALYDTYSYGTFNQRQFADLRPTGFICVNNGTIRNLSINDFTVSGGDYVGGFVGFNAGNLEKLETASETGVSQVIGNANVGGILGFQLPFAQMVTLTDLKNKAMVSGSYAVGGIAGTITNDFTGINFSSLPLSSGTLSNMSGNAVLDISLSDCVNYGRIQAKGVLEPNRLPEEDEYIGGIVGFLYNSYDLASEYDAITLSNCISVPLYKEAESGVLLSTASLPKDYLKGMYVGGIVGYNYHGRIENCNNNSFIKESGMIPGYRYVGGIAGCNEGMIEDCGMGMEKLHVIGAEEVGGVTGANSGILQSTNGVKIAANVIGLHYVGGIVGANYLTGRIGAYAFDDGNIDVYQNGCFAGGIAGIDFSNDLLSLAEQEAALIYASPASFKGEYMVGGYVGGVILNQSVEPLSVSPSVELNYYGSAFQGTVEAKAFAGSYIGYFTAIADSDTLAAKNRAKEIVDAFTTSDASSFSASKGLSDKIRILENLAPMKPSKQFRLTAKKEQNSKSRIKSQIYAGGVLGYADEDTILEINNINNIIPVETTWAVENQEEQKKVTNSVTTYRTTDYLGDAYIYTYSYAGGIIGKAGENITLKSCSNAAQIISKGTYHGSLCEINEGVIRECISLPFGIASYDYVGGLCGLNKSKGQIVDCIMKKGEMKGRNAVSAIAAENFGIISGIQNEAVQLTASGLSKTRKGIKETEGLAGLWAAHNAEEGMICLSKDISNVTVKSNGAYAGIVIGINHGTVKNQKVADDVNNTLDNLVVSGRIEAKQVIGGLIGYNASSDKAQAVSHFTGEVSVKSMNGQAGGIIGVNASSNTIKYCENKGTVIATDKGNCGGITSSNQGIIEYCVDYMTVTSVNGMCGGITALNEKTGIIRFCSVKALKDGDIIRFVSDYSVGAVAAENAGLISENTISDVLIKNSGQKSNTYLGVVTGKNLYTGIIYIGETVDVNSQENKNCSILVDGNDSFAGGVAGINEGLIAGVSTGAGDHTIVSLVSNELKLGNAKYATMGGVAGVNTGVIHHISVETNISGNLGGNEIGYGGIAGYSGYASKAEAEKASLPSSDPSLQDGKYKSLIMNCSFDGSIHANGSSGEPVFIGGIVGVNGYSSSVTDCYVGYRDSSMVLSGGDETFITAGDTTKDFTINGTDQTSNAYIGGIAGINYGRISSIDNKKYSKDKVTILSFAGASGGIVGRNYKDAIVTGYILNEGSAQEEIHPVNTSDNWFIEMRCAENDRGPGGIIGINESGSDLEYIDNYASVTCKYSSNVKLGGIIGVNMQTDKMQLKMRYCNNYGSVTGWGCSAGFIGLDFYQGIYFDHCNNYGEIEIWEESKGSQRHASGFISLAYSVFDGFTFVSCANHGNVTNVNLVSKGESPHATGFIAYFKDCGGDCYMTDCVNTGVISYREGGDDAQKKYLASFLGNANGMRWYMNLCRNYNTQTDYNTNGFAVGGDIYIKDCLDNTNLSTGKEGVSPFGGVYNLASSNNYYLDITSGTTNNDEHLDTNYHGAYFTVHPGTADQWKMMVEGKQKNYSEFRNSALFLREPSIRQRVISWNAKKETVLNFNLTKEDTFSGLDAFMLYFASVKYEVYDQYVCKYYYKVYFVDEAGNRYPAVIDTSSLPEGAVDDTYNNAELGGYNGIFVKATKDYSTYGVKATLPVGLNPKDVASVIVVTGPYCNTPVQFYGFAWIPTGESEASILTPLLNKTGVWVNHLSSSGIDMYYLPEEYDRITSDGNLRADLLDTNYYLPGHTGEYRLDSGGTRPTNAANITMELGSEDSVAGIGKIHYLLSNGKLYREGKHGVTDADVSVRYTYWYTITDMNGNTYSVPNNKALDVTVPQGANYAKLTLDIEQMVSDAGIVLNTTKLKKVTVYIHCDSVNAGAADRYIYFKGITWEEAGKNKEQRFAWYNKGVYENYLNSFDNVSQTGVFGIHKLLTNYSGLYGGTQSAPYVHADFSEEAGFLMDANDPVSFTYYADKTQSDFTKDPGINTRIGVYLDIDPKFVDFIQKLYQMHAKLKTPTNLKTQINQGRVHLTWNRVTQDINNKEARPYGYAIRYEVTDREGNILKKDVLTQSEQSAQGTQKWNVPLTIEKEWSEKGCIVTLRVKALSTENYSEPGNELDSDWSEPVSVSLSRSVLIQPKVHLELTSANKTVAVLENISEYQDEMVVTYDESGVVKEVPMAETCLINISYNGLNLVIDPSLGPFSTEAQYAKNSGYALFKATAVAKEGYEEFCTDSMNYLLRGMAFANAKLPGTGTFANTTFNGFYGDDVENITYEFIYYSPDDAYVISDLGAYDETIGEYVYYGKNITHMGGSDDNKSLKLTSIAKGLPESWFSEDAPASIEARNYLYRSQNNILHYGHVVAENLVFDKEDAAANRAILSGIKDPYFLSGNSDSATTPDPATDVIVYDYEIWDSGKSSLKPGYVIYMNEDGTADIYYNAGIALSMENADKYNVAQSGNKKSEELPDRKYYNYCVNVLIYANMADCKYPWVKESDMPISPDSMVNIADFTESFWVRYQNRVDRNWTGYDYYRKDTNNPEGVLEINPAPIVDGDIVIERNSEGNNTYSIAWDTFYQDTYCFNKNASAGTYTTSEWPYLTRLGLADTYADPDAVNPNPDIATWKAFRERGAIYDEYFKLLLENPKCANNSRYRQWMYRSMQAYYFTYANASYKAEIIGTTVNGEEIILKTNYVDTPNVLPSYFDTYTVYTDAQRTERNKKEVSTEYKRWNYSTTFVDEEGNWDQYEKISIRITHLGEDTSAGNINRSTSGNLYGGVELRLGKLSSDADEYALIRLPRYTERSAVQKERLATVSKPEIIQTAMDEYEYPWYTVSWDESSDPVMTEDTGGYLITVTDTSTEGPITTQYYYVNILSEESGEHLSVDNLIQGVIPTDVTLYMDRSEPGKIHLPLDLSVYDKRVVQISVRALARDNNIVHPTMHIHANDSEAAMVKVVTKLEVPDLDALSVSSEEEMKSNHNILLRYTDSDGRYEGIGLAGYEIEASISIYQQKDDQNELITLFDKESPFVIKSNTVSEAGLVDGENITESLFTEYAGYYLRLALRVKGLSSICSEWTDETAQEGQTKYVWIQIPELENNIEEYPTGDEPKEDETPTGDEPKEDETPTGDEPKEDETPTEDKPKENEIPIGDEPKEDETPIGDESKKEEASKEDGVQQKPYKKEEGDLI